MDFITNFAQFFFVYVARVFLHAESHRKTSPLVFTVQLRKSFLPPNYSSNTNHFSYDMWALKHMRLLYKMSVCFPSFPIYTTFPVYHKVLDLFSLAMRVCWYKTRC
jgi:hypothetical protein